MSNKEKIFNIVKNHFSLSENSLSVFEDRLYNPVIDDVYKSFGLDEEGRKYWEINDDLVHTIDKGWSTFKDYYQSFINHYSVTYKDFRNNKIIDERKNSVKLKKAMVNFYTKHPEIGGTDILPISGGENRFKQFMLGKSTYYLANYIGVGVSEATGWLSHISLEGNITELYEKILDKILTRELEKIGSLKIPNRKLYLVLSCNFEDWFFCSTGESWRSCLSLESQYFYWSGLPGLITDTNRAIIYVTDKSKKYPLKDTKYRDMSLDKMIIRSWVLLSHEGLNVVGFYPSGFIGMVDIRNIIGYDKVFRICETSSLRSKNSFRLLYHSNNIANSIYYDHTCLANSEKEPKGLREDTLFHHLFEGGGITSYSLDEESFVHEDVIFSFCDGLSEMINFGYEMEKGFIDVNAPYCCYCDCRITGEVFYADNEEFCYECFSENYSLCSDCGEVILNMYINTAEDGEQYCYQCYKDNFSICINCNNEHKIDEMVYSENMDGVICKDCLESFFVECSVCSDIIREEDSHIIDGEFFCCECKEENVV